METYLSMLSDEEKKYFNSHLINHLHYSALKKKSNAKDRMANILGLLGYANSLAHTTPNVTKVHIGSIESDTDEIKELVRLYNETQKREYLLLIEIFRFRVLGVKINERYDNAYDKYKL
jgi:hypothetical protein